MSMTRSFGTLVLGLALFTWAESADAQVIVADTARIQVQQVQEDRADDTPRLTLGGRGSYGLPIGDFAGNTDSDFGWGAGAVVNLSRSVGIYGGWASESFACDDVLCDEDGRVHVRGLEAGLKLSMPAQNGTAPWVKFGVVFHAVGFDGPTDFESDDRELGWQGAFGVDLPLGRVLSLSPSVRYQQIDVDGDGFFENPEVRHVSIDVGLQLHIPGF